MAKAMGQRAWALLGVFYLCIFGVGCDGLDAWLDEAKVTEPIEQFVEVLALEPSPDTKIQSRNYDRRQLADLVKRTVKQAIEIAKAPPRLSGQVSSDQKKTAAFVATHGPALLAWFDSFDRPLETLRKVLWIASKNALDGVSDRRQAALDYGLAFLALRSISQLSHRLEIAITPLATGLTQTQQDPEVTKRVVVKFATYMGLGLVVQEDLSRVSERMRQLEIPKGLGGMISGIAKNVREERKLRQQSLDEINAEKGENERTELRGRAQKLDAAKKLLAQTLLYVPGQAFSFVKLLAVISNLTWGLCNSVVGLGVIFWAMIASPFSEYVDFPSFTMSENGFQIWVNATGAIIPWMAFSLGVFVFGSSSEPYAGAHEGGHSFQSAILGPFYLPTVGISYLIQGHHGSFMETWADGWAYWAE